MIEMRQQARFLDEAGPPRLERVRMPVRLWSHRQVRPARSKKRRHVFLHRDPTIERVIMGQVDDAEAALADDVHELELVEPRPYGKRMLVTHRTGRRVRCTRG